MLTSEKQRRTPPFTLMVTAAVLLPFLAACSDAAAGDPDAGQTSSVKASETTTPTPTPTPSEKYKAASVEGPAENVPLPGVPEEAKVQSKEGLEAFARYWYDLVNYGFETGDVEPIRAISGPDCAVCKNFYQMVGPGYRDDDWIKGGEVVVRSVHSNYVVTPEGRYQVLIQNVQEPLEYLGPGILYGTHDGYPEPGVQMIEARYTESGWYADRVVTIQG